MEKTASQQAAARQQLHFFREFGTNIAVAIAIIAVSLGLGTVGYHQFAGMAWIDAFANAAMMASGMGPLDDLNTNPGRIFGACFALYAGFALVATTGLVVAPILSSFVERLHVRRGT